MWWKRKLDLTGLVFFRGALAPTLESLDGLAEAGIHVEGHNPACNEVWAATLRHSLWGRARVSARRGDTPQSESLVKFASGITDSERQTIAGDAQSVLSLIEPAIGGEPVALIDATTFMRSASPSDRALRDDDGHSDRRVVCCDSAYRGFIGRLFGSKDVRPSRLLCRGMIEGKHLIRFSDTSTDLTAARARESLSLLEPLRAEFEDLHCTTAVKIGYPTDSAGNGNEHLWFEVHGVHGDFIDATLLNEPFDIAAMKVGHRGRHSVELLTDWAIMTPIGQLTPRSLEVARKLRENRPQILEYLRSQGN